MGVWIETTLLCHQEKGSQSSHPMWVCGLKLVELIKRAKRPTVTPYMGVCIETASEDWKSRFNWVTPYMGVCIETLILIYKTLSYRHTLYGCVYWNNIPTSVRPLISSHTLYGCVYWNRQIGSYSAGVTCVTPYMGVCIETSQPVAPIFSHLSHPIWVCVLKQLYS